MNVTARATGGERVALALAYAANFGALAASTPFLALYLESKGFSVAAAAQVMALMSLTRVPALPGWTLVADRARSIGGVLQVVTVGALASFLLLRLTSSLAAITALLVAFAVFRAPFAQLLDALLLSTLRGETHAFGSVRAWGTAGYAVLALVIGALVARSGPMAVIDATAVLLGLSLLSTLALRKRDAALDLDHAPLRPLLASLLRRPRVLLLFGVALFQEMGLAPYDSLFPAYLTKLGGASAAGISVAVGAACEFLFMLGAGRVVRRLGPERVLALACAGSVVRWVAVAGIAQPIVLVVLQAFHALSFGAFYLTSVMIMDGETPPSLRASGQGIFGAFAFGLAASAALSLAGLLETWGSMRLVFAWAACASLVATGLALRLSMTHSVARDAIS